MGNEQSDIRFYTSLGEKALFEGQGAKPTHESRADSAYFTISFGDQEITNTEYGMCNFLLILDRFSYSDSILYKSINDFDLSCCVKTVENFDRTFIYYIIYNSKDFGSTTK